MIQGINYVAPLFDHSGYARAAREYFLALKDRGVPVVASPVSFDKMEPQLGEKSQAIRSTVNSSTPCNINIMHLTPEHYPLYKRDGGLNVGITIWETSRIPDKWVEDINSSVVLVIVPCEWNREVFIDSGVKKPIELVPYGLDPREFTSTTPLAIDGINESDFVFFSVFQWTERKNPYGLIRSYYNAFYDVQDVALVLKTYRSSTDASETAAVVQMCRNLKKEFNYNLDKLPKLLLITEILSDEDIVRLNYRGDCYVSSARSEGWGLGMFNAMAAGKPAISPGGTGNEVFMTRENSYLTGYTWTPVFGMPHIPWYDGRQLWLEPDLQDLINTMRHVYHHRDEAQVKGLLAKKYLEENFNFDVVCDTFLQTLNKYTG